jgi:hypothetical protein
MLANGQTTAFSCRAHCSVTLRSPSTVGSAIVLTIAVSYGCTAEAKQHWPVDSRTSINNRWMTFRTRGYFIKVPSRTSILTEKRRQTYIQQKMHNFAFHGLVESYFEGVSTFRHALVTLFRVNVSR